MRVLCLDHGALLRSYRQRYVEMARERDLELTVVAPPALEELNYAGQHDPSEAGESGYRLRFIRLLPARVHRGIYDPVALGKVIRSVRPDILHTQGEPETLSAGQASMMLRALAPRCRLIVSSWANIDLRRHGWPYRFGLLYEGCFRLTLAHASAATVYCAAAASILRQNGYEGRVEHIPWGVDTTTYRRRDAAGVRATLGPSSFVVAFIGRLEHSKGVATLIRAVARLGDGVALLVVGEGPARAEFEALGRRERVRIHWAGRITSGEVPEYVSAADVLVLPSQTTPSWAEQFGKILVEAMACEVPVVGSSSGEIPNVIGDAGLVFREQDPADLAAKLQALRADPDLRRELAGRGLRRATQCYSWQAVAGRTVALYRELCGDTGRTGLPLR